MSYIVLASVSVILSWLTGSCCCCFFFFNATVVPSWLLGPAVLGSLSYSLTYFTYAVMITSGLLVHCILLYECTGASEDNTQARSSAYCANV